MMENKVFLSFTFYSTILILKMYVVAIITGQVRLRKKAFANPEDALRNGGLQFCREDPDVERCLRAHRNDMENIFPFLFLGAIYSLLDPSPTVARIHFLIFCVGRIIHTIAYLLRLRAPTRSVAYSVAQLPCFSMALQILLATTPYWTQLHARSLTAGRTLLAPGSSQPAAAVAFPSQPHHSKMQSDMPGEACRNPLPWTRSLDIFAGHSSGTSGKSKMLAQNRGFADTVFSQRTV
uniref:Prostaglandin E synthase n=3 Tax=Ficedula albicollis TaxID=59894 RepID=U3JFE2_FICAL